MFEGVTIKNTSFFEGRVERCRRSCWGLKEAKPGQPPMDAVFAFYDLTLFKNRVFNVTFLD